MLGYYLNTGDQKGSDLFSPYIWGERGFDRLLKKKLKKQYGKDMDLLLIQYYIEGEFSSYIPPTPKVGNFTKKSKDIAVAIGVMKDAFHNRNEFERREFIVDSTLKAIELVRAKLEKKTDIDFIQLIDDVNDIAKEYFLYSEPYH